MKYFPRTSGNGYFFSSKSRRGIGTRQPPVLPQEVERAVADYEMALGQRIVAPEVTGRSFQQRRSR